MKRLLTYLFCASASLLFGCNTTPDPVLTVTPENLAFSAEGGAQTVQVKANNPWTASASGSGLSVNPSSGEGDATVTVTATATNSTNPLSGSVTFRSEGLTATVSVTQDERKVIQVGDVMVIPAEGGTFAVDLQYNTEYTVEVEASAKSWISFLGTRALQSGKLEFQFAENQNTEPRTGKVTVRDNSGKAAPVTLNFVQEEKKVITVGDVMTIPAEGGTFAVDIQYNTDFDVVVESEAQSWIIFVATRALKSGKLEFRFATNHNTDPRQGKVTIKDKSGKVSDITLTFVQAEKKVISIGGITTIPAKGGTFQVDIQYNTEYTVEVADEAKDWITFLGTRALTSGKLEFQFAENPNTDRQGKVTITDNSGKVNPITLNFVQAGIGNQEEIRIKNTLMQIYQSMDGPNWSVTDKWDIYKDLRLWSGVDWKPETGELGLSFKNFGLKGQLPDCFDGLSSCVKLWIQNEPGITGTLPASFSKLNHLGLLVIENTSMTSLPDIFSGLPLWYVSITNNLSMVGPVPESLGASDLLMGEEIVDGVRVPLLQLSQNGFTGTIPESWLRLGLKLRITNHKFSGQIPDYFYTAKDPGYWINMYINLGQTDEEYRKTDPFSIPDRDIPGYWPKRDINDVITGKPIPFDDIIAGNKATVMYKWASWCNYSAGLLPLLKKMHEKYHKDGLEVILRPAWGDNEGVKILKDYILERGYDIWYNFSSEDISLQEEGAIGSYGTPFSTVIDNKGNVIFSCTPNVSDPSRSRFGYTAFNSLIPFLEDIFGPLEDGEVYSSTDYSMDGKVKTLQKATVGKGINIVFMGDAYTDRDMEELYGSLMWQAMEEFFSVEPYKTFRDRFNVYAVSVVSKNGRTGTGYSTALGTNASGTSISITEAGTDKCYEYALKVPGINDKKNLLICVLVNSNGLTGITSMSKSLQSGVAYCASGNNVREMFGALVHHEAGGHGFAFLSDEYSPKTGSPSQAFIDEYNMLYRNYGWYSNVDFTNDPDKVKWSAFLNDDRYKDEVGIFEGGATFMNGVYRPSQNSIMKTSMEEHFNAPSRWAIYKRIMELSGETASFEKFLEYDAVNRTSASSAAKPPLKAAAAPERKIWYLNPPVVVQ